MPDLRPPRRPVPAKPLIAPRVRSRIGGHRGPPDLESCMSHVEGKVAVVTGGAGGFGLLIRRMLAERGATAVGFDGADAEGCRTVDGTERDPERRGMGKGGSGRVAMEGRRSIKKKKTK